MSSPHGREQHPSWEISVYSGPVGNLTSWQGYDFGIDCVLPTAPSHRSNNVFLMIDTCHLDRQPKIRAKVDWGQGSGPDSEEVSLPEEWLVPEDWLDLTDDSLDQIERFLPSLFQALDGALSRGCPPDEVGTA